jgi:hypothetical protein
MQGGRRRLVPDKTTQQAVSTKPVQTLADADLANIPEGPTLPSRANGAILQGPPNIAGAPGDIYRMAAGARRLVPDPETLAILNVPAQPVQSVSAEDLTAIPAGPNLPSFRDGSAYVGKGAVYALFIQAGKKRPVPDATSLRDLGHPTPPSPISDADIAAIPAGTAFPSTSRFLHPPDSKTPLVLLPVRLETRFQPNPSPTELWLRIYPDTVHIDSFEPDLTAEESGARAAYLAQAGTPAAQSAFSALAQRFGGQRAAWIVSADAQPGTKAAPATRAPWTKVLPERWIVIGYLDDGTSQVLATTKPIADTLAVGPDPKGPGPVTDDGMRWVADFNRAVAVGMAVKIPLPAAWQSGFSRIVVIGLRTGLDAAASAARLAELFRAHHYTDGLEFMPHGAATNNTEDVKSALATRDPGFAALYTLEQGPALCPSRPTSDGERLARALTLPNALFAHTRGADGGQDEQVKAMQTVLWPATWRYYLEQIVAGAVPSPQDIMPQVRSLFIDHVRGRGHYPILRIGQQPYGILAVSSSAQWKAIEGRSLDPPLLGLLGRLRAIWLSSVKNVPAITGASDAEQALAGLLSMSPSSETFSARGAIGPLYNTVYWRTQKQDLTDVWWQQFKTKTLMATGASAPAFANTLAARMTFLNFTKLLADNVVTAAPLDAAQTPSYVGQIASSTWQQLRDFELPQQAVPLLELLLRHAALRNYLDTASDLLQQAGLIQPFERLEPELVGLITTPEHTGPWNLLQVQIPGKGAVGTFLDGARNDASLGAFAEFWTAFNQLVSLSPTLLDQCTREVLDLGSYRLDAWISSFAHRRLDDIRRDSPAGGILLGAYGWVEEVRPAGTTPAPAPAGGFVHAPSLAHATTAAILRSGFLSHRGTGRGPFEIDLSSQRVRLGLHLLDGIREGQPLGALLGYRLERLLHENQLDDRIQRIRQNFPLGSPSVPEGGAQESIPSGNVVDGLALLRAYHGQPTAWMTWIPPEIEPFVKRLDDAQDALADLTLAESVYQLSRGNSLRAGATLDAIARGDAPPPDVEFVQTPYAGTGLTHRLFAVGGDAAPGWASTPRAHAEPRLNGWAASLLGDPKRVRARGRFVDSTGTALANIEIGIDQLNLAPLDVLAIPESTDPNAGELADRLRRTMLAARPATVPSTATVQILADRDPAWKPDVVSVAEWAQLVRAIAQTIAGARALEPRDLVLPGDTPGGIDNKDLAARADSAQKSLQAAKDALARGTGIDVALLGAAAFGIPGAVPAADSSQWKAQVDGALAEASARIGRVQKLGSIDRTKAGAIEERDFDVARLKAIFGDSFLVLPALAPELAATWTPLYSNSVALQGGDAFAAVMWFQRAARIRPGAGRLDRVLLFAEALGAPGITRFDVAQLPVTQNDRWLALPLTGAMSSGRVSLVAHAPQTFKPGSELAGLVVDEWTEVLPSAQQVSGLTFQFDEPFARPPQTILVAVRPDDFPEWTSESVEGVVLEALELAKIRAVDPDALETVGHYLPALYFAQNVGHAQVDAVSIDFSVAAPAGDT